MAAGAWRVAWTEHERGWGMRSDGYWYYESEEFAKSDTERMVKEARAEEKKIWNGATPDEYSAPEVPVFVPISEDLAAKIGKEKCVYLKQKDS